MTRAVQYWGKDSFPHTLKEITPHQTVWPSHVKSQKLKKCAVFIKAGKNVEIVEPGSHKIITLDELF